jgi:hypothetical protein
MLFSVAVIVVQMKKCGAMGGGYAGPGHALDLDRLYGFGRFLAGLGFRVLREQ